MSLSFDPRIRERAIAALAGDPDIRILRRVTPLEELPIDADPVGAVRSVIVLDTETTGLDPESDEIIDLAAIRIDIDERGAIVGVGPGASALRDPGFPIPPAITQLTGLRDEDVAGKVIGIDRLETFLNSADVLLAHNASFDAKFIEALAPGAKGKAWACSIRDFPWVEHGFDGSKLGHLLNQIGLFNEGSHRAMADVVSLVHLLAHRIDDSRTVIGHILESAARPNWRVDAVGAPFETRTRLKARGYRWDAGRKLWWIEVADDVREAEEAWLAEQVLTWGRPPEVHRVDWHQRYR